MKVTDLIIKEAKLVNGNENTEIDFFTINTNILKGNTIFIPLMGTTDGHNYILKNIDKLTGFICDNKHQNIIKKAKKVNKDIIIIEVDDTLKWMQAMAKKIRDNLTVPVIALTGSYGKTSQREMLYSVLKTKFKVLSTSGNYNNHIGMPLTLINYHDEEVVLLELGSNHKGEIEFLRNICRPNITTITCIGTAHIGNFKNMKNIYKEKTSITKGSDYFVLNMDDPMLKKFKFKNSIKFGLEYDNITNVIYGKKIRYTLNLNHEKYKVTINSDLRYLLGYSLCCMKIGSLLNIPMESIIKGINNYESPKGRMEHIENGNHIIINDCYNASFETMTSGLKYFYQSKYKNKIVVIGDILELGKKSKKIHLSVGRFILENKLKFKEIHLVGKEMYVVYKLLNKFGYNVFYYETVNEVNKDILNNKSVYLKASNGTNLASLLKCL